MKQLFYLLPSGRFVRFVGSSYFCGFYRGENTPPRPIEVELPFPFDYLHISFTDEVLRVNYTRYPYLYSTLAQTPPMPLVGCQTSKDLGILEKLDSLVVEGGTLIANGVANPLRDFPLAYFDLQLLDIARANQFLDWGFRRVEFVYAWYKPVFFLSFKADFWMTFYLRLGYQSQIENER